MEIEIIATESLIVGGAVWLSLTTGRYRLIPDWKKIMGKPRFLILKMKAISC